MNFGGKQCYKSTGKISTFMLIMIMRRRKKNTCSGMTRWGKIKRVKEKYREVHRVCVCVCVHAVVTSLRHVHLDNLFCSIFQTIQEKSLNRKRLFVMDVKPGHHVYYYMWTPII